MRNFFSFNPLLAFLLQISHSSLVRQIAYLKLENQILRSKLPKHISLTSFERQALIKFGKPLGDSLRAIISIVQFRTFRSWVRQEGMMPRIRAPIGRPRIRASIEAIVLQIARKTSWGYTRILGELKKLGAGKISRNTVKNILIRNGFDPGPRRGPGSWDQYIRRHVETLWACDFLVKRVWSWGGWVDYYLLFFIHIKTRKVPLVGITCQPDAAWLAQQSRNFCITSEGFHPGSPVLIRDGDIKFNGSFDEILKSEGITIKKLPPRSPNLNAYAERWVQSIKHECLNHFLVFGENHLRHLTGEYLDYYHRLRPHQGIGNSPPDSKIIPFEGIDPSPSQIRCESRLGGVLQHFYCKAA